jgi:hypothetical protein
VREFALVAGLALFAVVLQAAIGHGGGRKHRAGMLELALSNVAPAFIEVTAWQLRFVDP